MKRKILVQFDGGNFYKKVKKILPQIHLTNFDYAGLAQSVVKLTPDQTIYYVGEIRKYPGNKVIYFQPYKLLKMKVKK